MLITLVVNCVLALSPALCLNLAVIVRIYWSSYLSLIVTPGRFYIIEDTLVGRYIVQTYIVGDIDWRDKLPTPKPQP